MAGYRTSRASQDIRREITELIGQLKDPRVAGRMLTVVRVEVSSDLSYAKVYISDFSGIEGAKTAVEGLTAATGLIRRQVGKNLHLRKTPQIVFVADDSVEKSFDMFSRLSKDGDAENDG